MFVSITAQCGILDTISLLPIILEDGPLNVRKQ